MMLREKRGAISVVLNMAQQRRGCVILKKQQSIHVFDLAATRGRRQIVPADPDGGCGYFLAFFVLHSPSSCLLNRRCAIAL